VFATRDGWLHWSHLMEERQHAQVYDRTQLEDWLFQVLVSRDPDLPHDDLGGESISSNKKRKSRYNARYFVITNLISKIAIVIVIGVLFTFYSLFADCNRDVKSSIL
jgi:hypothetical protein